MAGNGEQKGEKSGEPAPAQNGRHRRASSSKASRIVTVGFLSLGVLLAIVYIRYVGHTREYLTTRSYRALGTASRQLSGTLEGVESRVQAQLSASSAPREKRSETL